jgi:hypothetical protein
LIQRCNVDFCGGNSHENSDHHGTRGFLLATPVANAWVVVGPPPFQCNTTISDGTINTNLIVPPNATCTLLNVTVTGNVDVEQGASLQVNPGPTQKVTINGNVDANKCNSVALGIRSNVGPISVGGNVSIRNCTGTGSFEKNVTIGNNVVCSGNASCVVDRITIQGNLTVDNNRSSTLQNSITGTTVSGNVKFSGNTGGNTGAPSDVNFIVRNTIGGNLTCNNNTPPPINEGATNIVTGNKSGQCANL